MPPVTYSDDELEALDAIGAKRTVTHLVDIDQYSLRDFSGDRR